MLHALLADLIVLCHVLVIVFVIGVEVAVIIGAGRAWRWIRRPVLRFGHLGLIVFIAVNAVAGVLCPLTDWEHALRRAGQLVEADISFVGRLVRSIIYYELPAITFTIAYVTFALLVLATLVLVPPRRRGRRIGRSGTDPPDGP